MTNQTSSKVLDRIRKLLAMANDERGNEHERETALRQAHSLLSRHGLDLMDLDDLEKEQQDPRDQFREDGWSAVWARLVYAAMGDLFMCLHLYTPPHKTNTRKQTHIFVGRTSNAATAFYMASYVVESIRKEARRAKAEHGADIRSFSIGCAHRIVERVRGMVNARAETSGVGDKYAVALVDLEKAEKAANLDFIAEWNVRQRNARASGVNSQDYRAGREFGDSIGLNVQVAKPNDNLALPTKR